MSIKRFSLSILVGVCLQSPLSHAANVDGDPGVDTNSDSGMYVWRNSGGAWHVRLVSANTQRQTFSGTFTSSGSITNVEKVSLESKDNITLSSRNTLTAELAAYSGGIDGVNFTTAQDASVCLRDSSGASRTVYLGANAVATKTPVDLTGAGACDNKTAATSTKEGLHVTQTSAGNWQVRLVSVDNELTFDGTFSSSSGFYSVQRVGLESADSAQVSPGQLRATFNAWPGGSDGIDFSVARSSSLCLRDVGSTLGLQVYVGESTTARNLPLALSGTDACGSASSAGATVTAATTTATTRSGGSHFGHYIALLRADSSQKTMTRSIEPGVQGFSKSYLWRQLEPTQGNYDFSQIRSDLDFLAKQGMYLIVEVEDKTFKPEQPLPPYLQGSKYTRANRQNGYTAVRWNPFVATRFKALLTALGKQFNNHAAFEGVIPGEETAPSLDDSVLNATGYTPEKYRDAIIDVLTTTARAMPKARVFWKMNFIPRGQDYIGVIANAVRGEGVIMGGPDVMPDDRALSQRTYPYYVQFKNKMDLFGQVEGSCYHALHASNSYPTKYWTPMELFRYARDTLGVNYLLWVHYQGNVGYSWLDALPVIAKYPAFNQ